MIAPDRAELEKLDRESLVQRAQAAGLKRARVLTRPELIDELLRRSPGGNEPAQLKRSRGFFGIARDLLSRVVERGLHLPDAAERFRQALDPSQVAQVPRPEAQAIPTVTLAEIYAAQGHKQRAVDTLTRVLEDEPDHVAARSLLEKLEGKDYVPPRDPLPPEPDYEPPPTDDDEVEADEVQAPTEDEEAAVETARSDSVEIAPEIAREIFGASPRRHVPIPREEPAPGSSAVSSEPELEDRALSMAEPLTVALPGEALAALVDDRCIAVGPYVWWQLSSRSRALALESFFFVRVVTIVPSWEGPEVSTRDLATDPMAGELQLPDTPRNAIMRVAVGFMPEGEFVPVAHSPALELGPNRALKHWTLDAVERSVLTDPLVMAAAQRAASF